MLDSIMSFDVINPLYFKEITFVSVCTSALLEMFTLYFNKFVYKEI